MSHGAIRRSIQERALQSASDGGEKCCDCVIWDYGYGFDESEILGGICMSLNGFRVQHCWTSFVSHHLRTRNRASLDSDDGYRFLLW